MDFQKAAGSHYNETSCTLPRFQVLTPVLTVGQVSRSKYCTTSFLSPPKGPPAHYLERKISEYFEYCLTQVGS